MYSRGGDGKQRGFGFTGFSISKKEDPPPPSQSGLGGMPSGGSSIMPGRSFGYHTNIGKKRARNEDE
jgi:hypothetical protein